MAVFSSAKNTLQWSLGFLKKRYEHSSTGKHVDDNIKEGKWDVGTCQCTESMSTD